MHAEALALAEKAYSFMPGAPNVIGLLAGLLMLTGDTSRAEALLPKLGDGRNYGIPVGFAIFHLLCGEIDRVADWTEQAIEQRHPLVYAFFGMLRSSCSMARNRQADESAGGGSMTLRHTFASRVAVTIHCSANDRSRKMRPDHSGAGLRGN